MNVYSTYQALPLLGTKIIKHTRSFSVAPSVEKYAKYKPIKQKLIEGTGESHTKDKFLKIVSEREFRAKRTKISIFGARTQERERKLDNFFWS